MSSTQATTPGKPFTTQSRIVGHNRVKEPVSAVGVIGFVVVLGIVVLAALWFVVRQTSARLSVEIADFSLSGLIDEQAARLGFASGEGSQTAPGDSPADAQSASEGGISQEAPQARESGTELGAETGTQGELLSIDPNVQGLLKVGETTVIFKRATVKISKDQRRIAVQLTGAIPGEEFSSSAVARNPALEFVYEFKSNQRSCSREDLSRYFIKFSFPASAAGQAGVLNLERTPAQAPREIITLRCDRQKVGGNLEMLSAGSLRATKSNKPLELGWNASINLPIR